MHQNLTHAGHPDPVSGAHCWLQKAINLRKALPGEKHGDVWVDTNKSMAVYHEWKALTRKATEYRPRWDAASGVTETSAESDKECIQAAGGGGGDGGGSGGIVGSL